MGTAADGEAGLAAFRAERPDLALLDVMSPRMNGISLCRRIRAESLIPVIMVSARDDPIDIVVDLEAGADDCVTKPFDTVVPPARIRALLRRAQRTAGPGEDPGPLRFGDLEIDPDGVQVRRAGRVPALTPTEMKLLLRFAESPGTVLGRDTLLEGVWEYAWGGDTRVVDVHVQRLRDKIGAHRIVARLDTATRRADLTEVPLGTFAVRRVAAIAPTAGIGRGARGTDAAFGDS